VAEPERDHPVMSVEEVRMAQKAHAKVSSQSDQCVSLLSSRSGPRPLAIAGYATSVQVIIGAMMVVTS